MPKWEFPPLDPALVEHELTQRDQFNNDDVGLAEALVREAIQNSSDAYLTDDQPVKVRFDLVEFDHNKNAWLSEQYESLVPHLKSCAVDPAPLSEPRARLLLIEDFNTKGLTGRYDTLDEGHFRNFWRRHGKSAKSGKAGGRWGLGKLVYSSSSKVKSFFGLTIRSGEPEPLLLGQAVLGNHQIDGCKYPPHGFWFDRRGPEPERLQLPISDPSIIDQFKKATGIARNGQSGLSIVIPYISDGVDEHSLLSAVVNNYYFPILAGKLVIEVGRVMVDRANFRDVAADVTRAEIERTPFDFVEQVSEALQSEPEITTSLAIDPTKGLSPEFFEQDDLSALKERFVKGQLIHAQVPVRLRRKSGEDALGSFRLFLRKRPENIRSYALIARGPITLPAERRYFQGAPALGALVAMDGEVASFLGDAENPAHTAWNANAEKLTANWRNASHILKAVRHSLRLFHELVAEQIEMRDENALIDFFALADRGRSTKPHKDATPVPKPIVPSQPKAIQIMPRKGGFVVEGGPGARNLQFPRLVAVKVAYDMSGGDPFKRYSKFDFDLSNGDARIETRSSRVRQLTGNGILIQIDSPDFRLEAGNFDLNRDLIVEARIAR